METIITQLPFKGVMTSNIGGRKENQDSQGCTETQRGLLLVVCDGMGGGPGGKTASLIAVTTIISYIQQADNVPELAALDNVTLLRNAVVAANRALRDKVAEVPELNGMGTTVTALLLSPQGAAAAHVGDSRIFQLRRGRLVFRTADHSRVGEMVRAGVLTEEQARLSAISNLITRALGINDEVLVETSVLSYNKGDRFVLCTDGVWGAMPQPELIKMFTDNRSLEGTAETVNLAVENAGLLKGGHHDNYTMIMVDTESSSLPPVPGKNADTADADATASPGDAADASAADGVATTTPPPAPGKKPGGPVHHKKSIRRLLPIIITAAIIVTTGLTLIFTGVLKHDPTEKIAEEPKQEVKGEQVVENKDTNTVEQVTPAETPETKPATTKDDKKDPKNKTEKPEKPAEKTTPAPATTEQTAQPAVEATAATDKSELIAKKETLEQIAAKLASIQRVFTDFDEMLRNRDAFNVTSAKAKRRALNNLVDELNKPKYAKYLSDDEKNWLSGKSNLEGKGTEFGIKDNDLSAVNGIKGVLGSINPEVSDRHEKYAKNDFNIYRTITIELNLLINSNKAKLAEINKELENNQ